MHIVIGGTVIKHEPAFELVGVSHQRTGVVTGLVLLRQPHVAFGINGVVIAEICDGRRGTGGAKYVRVAQETQGGSCPTVRSAEDAHTFLIDVTPRPERFNAGSLVINFNAPQLFINRIEKPFAATIGAARINEASKKPYSVSEFGWTNVSRAP